MARGKAPNGESRSSKCGRKSRRAWLQEEGPAFQDLAQIPAEATALLWCPNHTSNFYLVAPPEAWQARGFLEWSLGQRWGKVRPGLEGDEGKSRVGGLTGRPLGSPSPCVVCSMKLALRAHFRAQ